MISLKTYKVFEPVRMNGLLNGDMLAQAEVGTIPTNDGVVENGTLTNFGIDGKLNIATNKEKVFVVYNEPKNDFWVGEEYYAVDLEYELPRAIRLWICLKTAILTISFIPVSVRRSLLRIS